MADLAAPEHDGRTGLTPCSTRARDAGQRRADGEDAQLGLHARAAGAGLAQGEERARHARRGGDRRGVGPGQAPPPAVSDYTFAVRALATSLLNVGKAYSGLTDAETHRDDRVVQGPHHAATSAGSLVEPQIVIEVAFDMVQPSPRHKSGYALRFPRIVRLRPDKRPQDASTLDEVRAIAEDSQ